MNKNKHPQFTVHTPKFLEEINCNLPQFLTIPINVFRDLLAQVADRAAEIDDPKLNVLMLKLTLYECADPDSPEYDYQKVQEYIEKNQ